jgi:hypothetical protein
LHRPAEEHRFGNDGILTAYPALAHGVAFDQLRGRREFLIGQT